jgi:uncharacterized protein (TIGR03000 family)
MGADRSELSPAAPMPACQARKAEIMRAYQHLTGAMVALLVLIVAAFEARSEVHYNGGFIVTPKSSSVTPNQSLWRHDSHPSMHFGLPRLPTSGNYRAYYVPATTAPEKKKTVATNPYGIPTSALPWTHTGFEGYEEPAYQPGDKPLGHAEKYTLESRILPEPAPSQRANVALLVVHLPKEAPLWIEGSLTASKGRTRYFESPSLTPGKRYRYTVRAVWHEDGKWVSQTHAVPLEVGKVHCVYLALSPQFLANKRLEAKVQANLAQLSPEDQKAARLQRVCVVQPDCRLGAKGVPIKVMVKNRRVFVAAPDGVRKVRENPDKMLALALDLRKKNAPASRDK